MAVNWFEAVRSWLSPTCAVPECDEDAEPFWLDGGVMPFCAEHAVAAALVSFRESEHDGGQR
jgi:hypothetical protein